MAMVLHAQACDACGVAGVELSIDGERLCIGCFADRFRERRDRLTLSLEETGDDIAQLGRAIDRVLDGPTVDEIESPLLCGDKPTQ